MTITVTMLQTRRGEDGTLWLAGSQYGASDAFAAVLISSNLATGTLPLPVPSGFTSAQVAAVVADVGVSKRKGSLLRQGRPWMRAPTDTTPFTAGGGTTRAIVTRNGRKALELTVPASASLLSCWFAITPGGGGTITQQQHVTFEVEDASEWNGGSWRLGFYTANDAANGVRYSQTVGTSNGWNGIHCVAPLATEWANVGGGSFASVMTHCFFFFQRKASPTGTTRIWIYEIAESEKNTLPSICIAADDGHATWYSDGLPLAEKYGLPVSMAFIADDRGTANRMSAADWYDACVTRGHTAVVHGCKTGIASLRDYFATYAPYSSPAAAISADITYNRDALIAEGLDPDGRGRTFYVLPAGYHQPSGGAGDDTIIDACEAAGMTAMRRATVENAIICNGAGAGAAMYLPIIGHSYAGGGEAANITAIVTQMQTEIAAGRSVILMFHEVRSGPTLAEQITAANLETILAAAATLIRAGTARAGRLTDLASELASYTSPVHVGQ